jgi:hypothetical protein
MLERRICGLSLAAIHRPYHDHYRMIKPNDTRASYGTNQLPIYPRNRHTLYHIHRAPTACTNSSLSFTPPELRLALLFIDVADQVRE